MGLIIRKLLAYYYINHWWYLEGSVLDHIKLVHLLFALVLPRVFLLLHLVLLKLCYLLMYWYCL